MINNNEDLLNTKTGTLTYQIRIQGHLKDDWSDWMRDVEITNLQNGETIIFGECIDQAKLHGLLQRIRDLGMKLIEVKQIECKTKKELNMDEQSNPEENKIDSFIAIAYRWSIFIVAIGLSILRTGTEKGIIALTTFGVILFLSGTFLWVYKHYYNIGLIVAIFGGSLLLLGNPNATSTLFGDVLSGTEKAPMLIWGGILTVIGLASWVYFRYIHKKSNMN